MAGTRIPAQAVLELVRESVPFASIIHDYYPDLKMEDIQARAFSPLKCWPFKVNPEDADQWSSFST